MWSSAGSFSFEKLWLRIGRWGALALTLMIISIAHVKIGGLLIEQTNFTDKDILGADQKHNMKMARLTRDDLSPDFSVGVSEPIKALFPHRTDGVVNPLWPWIAAWLLDDEIDPTGETEVTDKDREFFNRGRWFHVGWTLAVVIVLGFACMRVFSLGGTVVVMLLTGFGALLPRAAYFQPEPIYFVFFAATWVACMFALQKNSLWMHALVGGFGGIAYLAKGSVQPLLMAYVFVSTMRWLWGWVEARRSLAPWFFRYATATRAALEQGDMPDNPDLQKLASKTSNTQWLRRNHWLGLIIMAFCFFMTTGPRLSYSWKTFGDPFHSFPGYWMWFDDFKDCYAWMGEHNSREKLEATPKSERPSFSNYAKTHTGEQMWTRLVDGTKAKVGELLWPGYTTKSKKNPKPWKGVLELRGLYLGWLALVLGGITLALRFAAPRPANAAQRVHPETVTHVCFVLCVVVGYSLAYGWYTPFGRGDRFMLSLYAPLVLCLVWAGESLMRRARRRKASKGVFIAWHTSQWLLVAAVAWRLIEIWRFPFFRN